MPQDSDPVSNPSTLAAGQLLPASSGTTPMMGQWFACKKKHPTTLLFFRLGDFYEAFYDDAVVISNELGIALTQRQAIPMCGVPSQTIESQIDKLVQRGHRVAIAEQMEDAKEAKGLVKRDVARVVTPGTLIDSTLLKEKRNNFFVSIVAEGGDFGLAVADVSTGELLLTILKDKKELYNELCRLQPAELLCGNKFARNYADLLRDVKLEWGCAVAQEQEWYFEPLGAQSYLMQHFRVETLQGFGIEALDPGVTAAGALMRYLSTALILATEQMRSLARYDQSDSVAIDGMTQRNLELFSSLRDGSAENTLLQSIDGSVTPMGGRLLHTYLRRPLRKISEIEKRLDIVEAWLGHKVILQQVRSSLQQIRDCQRLVTKTMTGSISPRDLVALKSSLEAVKEVEHLCRHALPISDSIVADLIPSYSDVASLVERLNVALVDAPPLKLGEGASFRQGYSTELDEQLWLKDNSKQWLAEYQQRIREETGIKTLKVGFNRVFGYYIEVSAGQVDKMPSSFIRRQTLANGERYISNELKSYEDKILHAEERIAAIEGQLFKDLLSYVQQYHGAIIEVSDRIARVDLLQGFAFIAMQRGFVRPSFSEDRRIEIIQGRHPVVERAVGGHKFVPNDLVIDGQQERMLLITGPNMGGKSTYMRQCALIVLMAQLGSFVPAQKAVIGIVDKIFSRIGASDDLAKGHSTFMVEMIETANILNNATDRSLIILDEIGRGTSTYDGIAIAWAVAEHLLLEKGQQGRVLFATHYLELTQLAEMFPGVTNYHVKVAERDGTITLLHQVVPGTADRSYGIHVAQIAGIPEKVISRATALLSYLEKSSQERGHPQASSIPTRKGKKLFDPKSQNSLAEQLGLFPNRGEK
jgi:DNA mismatch repair protein MutS